MIVHHTDGEREFRYDREQVPGNGWAVAAMKADWNTMFRPNGGG